MKKGDHMTETKAIMIEEGKWKFQYCCNQVYVFKSRILELWLLYTSVPGDRSLTISYIEPRLEGEKKDVAPVIMHDVRRDILINFIYNI